MALIPVCLSVSLCVCLSVCEGVSLCVSVCKCFVNFCHVVSAITVCISLCPSVCLSVSACSSAWLIVMVTCQSNRSNVKGIPVVNFVKMWQELVVH